MAGATRDATRRPGAGGRWILLTAAVGFAASALLTRGFHLERQAFVAAWAPVVLVVWLAYARSNGVSRRAQLSRRWAAGLVIGAAVGAVLALTVARQPTSPVPTGLRLLGVRQRRESTGVSPCRPVLSQKPSSRPQPPCRRRPRPYSSC